MSVARRVAEKLTSAYDPEAAYLSAVLATWSYAEQEALQGVVQRKSIGGPGGVSIKSYHMRNPALPIDAQGYLISFGGSPDWQDAPLHVLALRGTEPTGLTDFLTDALVEPHIWADDPNEWVHRGFFLGFDVLWPRIAADLGKIAPDKKLLVTGHSLGGAIATLVSRAIWDHLQSSVSSALSDETTFRFQFCGTYTFGQPMVGNQRFAKGSAKLNLYRHVFGKDVVVHLPPQEADSGEDGYHHLGIRYAANRESLHWTKQPADDAKATLSELTPAFVTLLTDRLPQLPARHPLGLLWFFLQPLLTPPVINGIIPNSLPQPLRRLLGTETWQPKYSVDDHIPTHYVDVSGASLDPPRIKLARYLQKSDGSGR